MKFKGIAIFFLKNTPKKQIQCNKSREGDPLTLLGHPLPEGGGSLNEYTCKTIKLLRLQTLLQLNRPRKLGTPLGS